MKTRNHPFFGHVAAAAILVLLAPGQPGARSQAKAARPALGAPPAAVRALALPDAFAANRRAPGGAGKQVASSPPWTAWREPAHQTPVFVEFNRPPGAAKRAAAAPEAEVLRFIAEHAELFRLRDPAAELVHRATRTDRFGGEHVQLEHRYLGVPVWGASIVGHLNPEQGLYAINGRYLPSPDYITSVEPSITREAAIERASADLALHTPIAQLSPATRALLEYPGPGAGLYLWSARLEDPVRLTWSVEIRPNIHQRWRYFIDAGDGRILDRYLASPSDGPAVGSGDDLHGNAVELQTYESDGLFYLIDGSREDLAPGDFDLDDPRGALLTLDAGYTDVEELEAITSADNTFADPVAVSAHANMQRVYEYFLENHDRRGIGGDGSEMISVIHVTEDGEPMENAYWNGVLIAYGDGGDTFGPLAGSLDVAAHEMTHGIIERSVNLEFRFQSGALNESFADVFSAMVDDDWLVGEDIVNEAVIPSGALRDLSDPHNGDEPGGKVWQPAHMDEYQELDEDDDNGGVHLNSGIPNRAAYLVAEAIGREKTAQIYYRILEASYLTARSQFVDCRLAAQRAARDLFGDDSAEVEAVSRAYDAVGIVPEEPATSPGTPAAGSGTSWVSTVTADPGDNSLWLVKPGPQAGEGWEYRIQLTATPVLAVTGHAVTAPVNGDFLLFVDGDHNLRYIGADGSAEEVINADGDWHSVALSPDGSRLVATTVYDEPSIWYFDLNEPENGRAIELYHPTTQDGIRQAIARFADALLWDATGNYVIYDAFNSLPGPAEETIDFWTVNILDPLGEAMWSIFPPQPEGVHIGNPSLSSALLPDGTVNDCRLLYERIEERSERSEIRVIDLCTGEEGVLHAVDVAAAFPGFINGDREIVFEEWTAEGGGTAHLRRLALAEDGLSSSGEPVGFVPDSQSPKPLVFASDDIPLATAVEDGAGARQPTAFSLGQNYPNPFNAGTLISYSLPSASRVILDVFNANGQRVAAVDQGRRPAGIHAASWTGADASGRHLASGIYFYRLRLPGAEPDVEPRTRKMLLLR